MVLLNLRHIMEVSDNTSTEFQYFKMTKGNANRMSNRQTVKRVQELANIKI